MNFVTVISLCAVLTVIHTGFSYENAPQQTPEASSNQQNLSQQTLELASTQNATEITGFSLDLEFLYWSSRNNGYSYAFLENGLGAIGTSQYLNTNWEPGVRVAGGWNLGYERWDLVLCWTYYHNRTRTSVNADIVDVTTGRGIAAFYYLADLVASAKADWMLNYNTIDLELGKEFFVSKFFILRPFFGPRGGAVYQNFNIQYDGEGVSDPETPVTIKQRNNFWGVGIRSGISAKALLGKGFHLFGIGAASLLYGKTNAPFFAQLFSQGTGSFQIVADAKNSFTDTIPSIQSLFGIGWNSPLRSDKMFMEIGAAWEFNYWWDQHNTNRNTIGSGQPINYIAKPLALQGLTTHYSLDF